MEAIGGEPRAVVGQVALQAALRDGLAEAAVRGVLEMWWCDTDYAHWPLNEPGTLETLSSWARAHRRLVVCAKSFDVIARRHPRWVAWRRTWSHTVECRAVDCADQELLPTVLLAPPALVLRVEGGLHPSGTTTSGAAAIADGRRVIDAYIQRSTGAFPATTLGL